jgi:hypothetical protein
MHAHEIGREEPDLPLTHRQLPRPRLTMSAEPEAVVPGLFYRKLRDVDTKPEAFLTRLANLSRTRFRSWIG